MNSREKFADTINFNGCEQVPDWEFAYWYDTVYRWYKEGLPMKNPPLKLDNAQWVAGEACPGPDIFFSEAYYGNDVHDYFGFDERIHLVAVDTTLVPAYEEAVFEEDEENLVYRRGDGKTVKTKKDGSSMPHFIEYPVKTEEDFEGIKMRFNPDSPERFPKEWAKLAAGYKSRTYPLQLGGGNFSGFYSIIREMMGVEESLYVFYDNPDFATRILDFFLDFYIRLYTKVLTQVEVDYILIWEDLAFKNGPLISPEIFKEFILPYYKKFTGNMRELGVKHFFVDTDGNFEVLIPLFIEGGVTGFYPFEAAAGMDIEKIRSIYPQLVIMGGIDKKALAAGKTAIDMELGKVERMLKKGGFIPYTDHMVPPEVSFDNYKYFRTRMKEIINA